MPQFVKLTISVHLIIHAEYDICTIVSISDKCMRKLIPSIRISFFEKTDKCLNLMDTFFDIPATNTPSLLLKAMYVTNSKNKIC